MIATEKKYLGETGPVREGHEIDLQKLHTFMADMVTGFDGPLTVKQFEGGQSNPTYLIDTPTNKYVLRRKPPGVLLKSAHAVDREYRVMSTLGDVGFPVPRVHVLCDDESVLGTMFFIMDFVPGRVFLDCTMPDLLPAERSAVFDSVNETLAALHSVDYAALGLEDFGRPGNYFARQIARWSKQYDASKTSDIPAMDRLIDWLPGAIPDDDATSLVHGDYSFHNVLIHPSEPKVVAVLDWELSTTGHPLGDLMYHMMEWYRPPGVDSRGTLHGLDLDSLGIPTIEAYMARYCERTGRAPIENPSFYKAYNLFRVAAIVQGIVGRAQIGTAAAANASEQAERVQPLAEAAWREAQRAGAV